MKNIADFVLNNPRKIIIVSLLITVLLATGLPKIHFEEDIKAMIPKDLPSRLALNHLEEIFGGSDVALIGIGLDNQSIFNVGTLGKIRALTDSLEVMDGINRVTSLATISYMEGHDWGLEVIPYLEYPPETEEEATEIQRMFFRDSTYAGILVSDDSRYTAIIAQVSEGADIGLLYEDIKSLVSGFEGPEKIYEAGTPIVTTIISQSMKNDLRKHIPFVILLILILLYLSFRSALGVVLPMGAVIMSLLSMLGMMGHLGITFTTINNIMPVILLGIGIDYGIHIMANYYQEAGRLKKKREAVSAVITDIGTPMVMACLTTMAGFLSLISSPLTVHHEFGFLLSFGIFMALTFNMTFVPAILSLLPMPKAVRKKAESKLLEGILNRTGATVIRFRHAFTAAGVIVAAIAAFGIPKVDIEMNPISFFPEESEIVQSDRMINEHLGGSVNMNILYSGSIQSEEVLNSMDSLQAFLDSFEETGSTISLAKVVKKINKALNSNDPEFEVIPDTDQGVAQAILMYETSGDPTDFESLVDYGYENGQVVAMLKSNSTEKIRKISNAVDGWLAQNIPDGFEVITTGFSVFFKDLAYLIVQSQINSISLAVLLVFLIAFATYRSVALGMIAIIPFSMCVVFNFGLMGYAGIELSIPMAMFSSMIIGIGVDFSFHLISRFKYEIGKNSKEQAVANAVRKVGEPILYSALTTACGGFVLTVSGFVPVRFLGMMLALIMLICAVLALSLLPAALTYVKTKK